MKSFIDNIFKPYLFPLLLLIFGAYLKVGDNLKSVGEFFSNSTNSFIKFFSYQFYLWEVIFYLVVIFILRKIFKLIFQSKSKKERQMLKAIKTDFPHGVIQGWYLHNWVLRPAATEGYRTAEVTLGGIDTAELSSKTMECKRQPGLDCVGEVVDVTGHLGGFNFQWAWASAQAAGQVA